MLQGVTHLFQVREQRGITGIDHIADPVTYPIGTLVRESDIIGSRSIEAFRKTGHRAIDRDIGNHITIIITKPETASHLTGQPGAHLRDERESRLLGRDWTLVEIFFPVYLII